MVEKVRRLNVQEKAFHAVEAAFLEFAKPDTFSAIEALNEAGCDLIVVVPLFIAPSGHSLFDVNAVLGLYTSPDIRRALAKEGARVAHSKAPIVVVQTLDGTDLLDRFACDEARALSEHPTKEALLLIAHGSPDHAGLIEKAMRRIVTYCCARTGIAYGDWAFCEMGQSFQQEVVPAIIRAARHGKKVLVVGLYVSSSAELIATRFLNSLRSTGGTTQRRENPLNGINVVFSKKCVAEHPAAAAAVLDAALGAVEGVAKGSAQGKPEAAER